MTINEICTADVHSFNVGKSDYSTHKIQPWDIWEEYNLDPWEADVIKRILRKKEGTSRVEDLAKCIHILRYCINREVAKANALQAEKEAAAKAVDEMVKRNALKRTAGPANGPQSDDIPDDATMDAVKPVVDEPSAADMAYVQEAMNPNGE